MAEIQNKHAVDEYSQTYSVEKKNGPGSCWNQTLSEMQLNLDSNATFSKKKKELQWDAHVVRFREVFASVHIKACC